MVVALLLANVGVAGLKELVGSWSPRPAGARACDAFCMNGPVGGRPGFPSGHVMTATMFVALLWSRTRSTWTLWIGVPWILAMAWSRWAKQCHTPVQMIGGVFFGLAGAAVYAQVMES
jgi:membrane-associated phospholipid phosphatase